MSSIANKENNSGWAAPMFALAKGPARSSAPDTNARLCAQTAEQMHPGLLLAAHACMRRLVRPPVHAANSLHSTPDD